MHDCNILQSSDYTLPLLCDCNEVKSLIQPKAQTPQSLVHEFNS